jgi:hypothetical protein
MRRLVAVAMLAPAFVLAPAAGAHPGAAPWEADGRPGRQSCATCHFEAEPVKGSAALSLAGLPGKIEPGKVYDLTLTLKHAGMKVAGFLVSAMGGTFVGGEGVEVQGAAARSTLAKAKQADAATWRFSWRAPQDELREAAFFVSANAGNDDQSPFGDIIYMDVVKAK